MVSTSAQRGPAQAWPSARADCGRASAAAGSVRSCRRFTTEFLGACCGENRSALTKQGKTSTFFMVFAAVCGCGVDMVPLAVSMSSFDWRLLFAEVFAIRLWRLGGTRGRPSRFHRLLETRRMRCPEPSLRSSRERGVESQFRNALRHLLWQIRAGTSAAAAAIKIKSQTKLPSYFRSASGI